MAGREHYEWRVTMETFTQAMRIAIQMGDALHQHDEGLYQQLYDQMCRLPNYPHWHKPGYDYVTVILTDNPDRTYSLPTVSVPVGRRGLN